MAYVFLIVQLAVSIGMLALFGIAAAFQGESLRWSTTTTKIIDAATFLVLLTPVLLTFFSFTRIVRGRPAFPPTAIWFAIFLVCGFATMGLMTLKDKVGYASKHAALEKHRAELLAAARAGDGEKACELVVTGEAPADVFPLCRAWMEQATNADERLRRLSRFISGGWLPSGVIPESDQIWFVRAYFTALVEATPGSSDDKPGPTSAFDDLLRAGSALSGIGRPDVMSKAALCELAAIVPKLEEHYAARLKEAETANAERATYFKSVLGDARERCKP